MRDKTINPHLDDHGVVAVIVMLWVLLVLLPLLYHSQSNPELSQANHSQFSNLLLTSKIPSDESIHNELLALDTKQSLSSPNIRTVSRNYNTDGVANQTDIFIRTSSHSFPSISWSHITGLSHATLARRVGEREPSPQRHSQFSCRYSKIRMKEDIVCAGNIIAEELIHEGIGKRVQIVSTGDCIIGTLSIADSVQIICGGSIEVGLLSQLANTSRAVLVSNSKISIDNLLTLPNVNSNLSLSCFAKEGIRIMGKRQGEIYCSSSKDPGRCVKAEISWPWASIVGKSP